MKRRKFIHNGVVFSLGTLLMNDFFASCRKNEYKLDGKFKGRVVVVGAGAAGLYCAQLLHEAGCGVTILEAGKQVGGRIRKLDNFSDFPVEIGAEEVHGERGIHYRLAKSAGFGFVETETEEFIYSDNKLKTLNSISGDSDFSRANGFLDDLEESLYSGGDVTLEKYISTRYHPRVWAYLNALVANENGTSADRISLEGVSHANSMWKAGSENFLLKGGAQIDLIKSACAGVLDKVVLNSVVKKIDYGTTTVTISTSGGKKYEADKVVVTVPLTQLQQRSIGFVPALPEDKLNAISKIGMGAGMKVILKFSKRFWADNLGSIYGNGLVPEFWGTGTGRSVENNCLTAFVHGRNAEKLLAMGGSLMISAILQELDDMFGVNVASGSYTDFYIMNWTNEPYINGTYSYPAVGEGNAREVLARSLEGRLFFAGEATHTRGHFGTVLGALETGVRAAGEILGI